MTLNNKNMSMENLSLQMLNLLNGNNFNIYNVSLAKQLGINVTIYYQALLKFNHYYYRQDTIGDDGFFYATTQRIFDWTGLKEDQQRTARTKLIEAKLIEFKVVGMPAKGHYKINNDLTTLVELISDKFGENPEQEGEKSQTSSLEIPTISNNISNTNKKEKESSKATQPSLIPNKKTDPVLVSAYNYEIINDAISYLNTKTNKNFSVRTQATIKHINARIKDGYTLEQFKYVINVKCASWLGDDKMEQYLRPETLFGTKFNSYLNEKMPKGGVSGKGKNVESIDNVAVAKARQQRSNEISDEVF